MGGGGIGEVPAARRLVPVPLLSVPSPSITSPSTLLLLPSLPRPLLVPEPSLLLLLLVQLLRGRLRVPRSTRVGGGGGSRLRVERH